MTACRRRPTSRVLPNSSRKPEHIEPAPEAFVAPRGHAAGTPSPEALQRLQAAVQKVPSAPQRPAAPRQSDPVSQSEPEERSRFGFNRLIDRMTGHASDTPAQSPRQQPVLRQSEATAPIQEEVDPDQERIEIPAFLRRQAKLIAVTKSTQGAAIWRPLIVY